jgi:hypothetical protein
MVMDRIGGFSNLGRAFLEKFQGSDRTDATVPGRVPANNTPVAAFGGEKHSVSRDKVEISTKAHQLNDLRNDVESGREALDRVPEIRHNRVAEVRARLDRGYYNSLEVRGQVAEKLNEVARTLEAL